MLRRLSFVAVALALPGIAAMSACTSLDACSSSSPTDAPANPSSDAATDGETDGGTDGAADAMTGGDAGDAGNTLGYCNEITHGEQLTSANTGPGAIGITTFKQEQGGRIDATAVPSYARVSPGETIDGYPIAAGTWVIEGVEFATTVSVVGAPVGVVFRGCKFRFATGANSSGQLRVYTFNAYSPSDDGGMGEIGSGDVLVSYCDMGAPSDVGAPCDHTNQVQYAIDCDDRAGGGVHLSLTVSRTYVSHGWGNAIQADIPHFHMYASFLEQPTFFCDCAKLDAGMSTSASCDHTDAFLSNGKAPDLKGVDDDIIACSKLDDGDLGQTNAIGFQGSGYSGITVKDNWVAGGGYTIAVGGSSAQNNTVVTGNKFSMKYDPFPASSGCNQNGGGCWGPFYPTKGLVWSANGNQFANNTWADGPLVGQTIAAP